MKTLIAHGLPKKSAEEVEASMQGKEEEEEEEEEVNCLSRCCQGYPASLFFPLFRFFPLLFCR